MPVQVAVQSKPQAAVHPAVPVQATAQWSPQMEVHAAKPVQVQLVLTQMQPNPPAAQLGGPPGLGADGRHPATKTHAQSRNNARLMFH